MKWGELAAGAAGFVAGTVVTLALLRLTVSIVPRARRQLEDKPRDTD